MTAARMAIALLLVLGTAFVARTSAVRRGGETSSLEAPLTIGEWHGEDGEPLDAATRQAIAADVIVNRTYRGPTNQIIGLYIASYAEQRPGVSIHSPLHCLPGTGWSVLTNEALSLNGDADGAVRRLIAVRDRARVLILYWYDIHGRLVANDLQSRLYLLHDSVRFGRNGASLVRLVVPVRGNDDAGATREALAFLRLLLPRLSRPSASDSDRGPS